MYKVIFSLLLVFFIFPTSVLADSHDDLISGVINAISADDDGHLEGILLMTNDGQFVNIDVKSGDSPTEYGLENIAGDRWVGNQNDDSLLVVSKLKDLQERFAPITILHTEGVAKEIVDMEKRNVSGNLNFLFACFAVAWVAFFGYLVILNGRIKKSSQNG
ncbi:MAG: hypothetical protein CL769_04075 [Chloroflexi bacterium]|nr:hypothetical protein [Chloroflexota bacterium]|tara:strand:+ start:308 stop:790 length:483 start_codon:yes stop_codon:yes gene_type:complete